MRKINEVETIALILLLFCPIWGVISVYILYITFTRREMEKEWDGVRKEKNEEANAKEKLRKKNTTYTLIDAITMSQVLVIDEKWRNSPIFIGAKCYMSLCERTRAKENAWMRVKERVSNTFIMQFSASHSFAILKRDQWRCRWRQL